MMINHNSGDTVFSSLFITYKIALILRMSKNLKSSIQNKLKGENLHLNHAKLHKD